MGRRAGPQLDERTGNCIESEVLPRPVLRMDSTSLIARRMQTARTPAEKIFALMMLGDEREIGATYIMGKRISGSL